MHFHAGNKVNGGNPNNVDASEQYVVSCSGGGSCSGGLSWRVFDWMVSSNKNIETEANMPDNGNNGVCPGGKPNTSYYATNWGICRPDGDITKIASVSKIKEAICKYGAVKTSLVATSLMQAYTNGVFNETPSNYSNPSSNHAVLIVGWDDNKGAWLIKNSWGTNWGMNGYMWIAYGSNNVGRRACWVKAKKVQYQVNPGIIAGNPVFTNPTVNNPSINPSVVNVNNTVVANAFLPKTYVNKDNNTRGITKLIISADNKRVQTFGACHPTDCDWGNANMVAFRGSGYNYTATYNTRAGKKTLYINNSNPKMIRVKLVSKYSNRAPKTNYYSFIKK